MKKFLIGAAVAALFIGSSALAADMAKKAPPASAPAPYNWTGFYLGAEFGGGWSNGPIAYSPNDPIANAVLTGGAGGQPTPVLRIPQNSAVGGIEAGYNWQAGVNWLVGMEADFSLAGMGGTASGTSVFSPGPPLVINQTITAEENTDWYGTLRGRVGWLATPNLLLFGSGGFAYGRVAGNGTLAFSSTITATITAGFQCVTNGSPCFTGSSAENRTGWVAGGGAEYLLDQHWSAKIEYQLVDLGGETVRLVSTPAPGFPFTPSFNVLFRDRFNVVRVGLNYRFW
jgi:outer membrane immunogenic protein